MPKLVYQDPESGQEVTVEINDAMPVVTIGRNPGNIVRVNNPSISRQHAKIVWEDATCTLFDLDSSNGSYVNGTRVRSQSLTDQDRVRVGEFPIDYHGEATDGLIEISADQIEPINPGTWEDGTPKSSTNLGGFAAHLESDEPSESDYDAGPINFDEPSFVEDRPLPPDPVFDDVEPLQFDEPSFSDVSESEPSFVDELSFAEPSFGDDADPIAFDDPSIDDVPEVDNNASGLGMFPRSEASMDDIEDAMTVDDNEIISMEPSEADGAFEFASEPHHEPAGLSEPSINDQDTFEASLEELNQHLQRASEAGNDVDDPLSSLSGRSEVPQEIGIYEERITELERERDDLLDLLQERVGDINSASKVQIERLRTERDRLIDERRRMKREIGSLRGQLDSLPTPESIARMELELTESRQTASEHESVVEGLQNRIADLMGEVDARKQEIDAGEAQLQKFREAADAGEDAAAQLVTTTGELESARTQIDALSEQTQNAVAELEEFQEIHDRTVDEKNQLAETLETRESEIAQLTHTSEEREQDIAELQTQLGAAHEKIDGLLLERDGLATELQSRPPADEVQTIVAELASTRADLESAVATIEDLETLRDGLMQESSDQRELYAALEERFEKQGAEFEIVERERDALKTEKGAFARETDYLQVEKRQLDSEVRALKKELKEYATNDRRKKQIFDELRGDLERLVGENTLLEEKIVDLEQQVSDAPSAKELEAAIQKAADAEQNIDALKTALAEVEKEADQTTAQLGKLVEDHDVITQALENANIELDALRSVVAEGSDALSKIETLEKSKKKLETSLKKTEKDLDKKLSELEQLTAQLAEKEVEVAELQDQTKRGESDLAQKVNKLEGQLLDAEKTLAEIILERDRLEDELKKSKN